MVNISDKEIYDATMDLREEFISQFCDEMVLFDPLDRVIPEDDDQTTKRFDLIHTIDKLDRLPSSNFSAPFTTSLINRFQQLLQREFDKFSDNIKKMIE